MRKQAGRLALAALAAGLAGCTMSAEWFVKRSLQRAGYSRAEAQCVAKGVGASLNSEQLYALRSAIPLSTAPAQFESAGAFVAWLDGRVDERTRQVLLHYATSCRRAG